MLTRPEPAYITLTRFFNQLEKKSADHEKAAKFSFYAGLLGLNLSAFFTLCGEECKIGVNAFAVVSVLCFLLAAEEYFQSKFPATSTQVLQISAATSPTSLRTMRFFDTLKFSQEAHQVGEGLLKVGIFWLALSAGLYTFCRSQDDCGPPIHFFMLNGILTSLMAAGAYFISRYPDTLQELKNDSQLESEQQVNPFRAWA